MMMLSIYRLAFLGCILVQARLAIILVILYFQSTLSDFTQMCLCSRYMVYILSPVMQHTSQFINWFTHTFFMTIHCLNFCLLN